MQLRTSTILVLLLAVFCLPACSPMYVVRAGWEEASILWNRQDIDDLLKQKELDSKLRTTFTHVLNAKEFSKKIGLMPDDSFSQYSEIDRDVLLWVLTASPKDQLSFKTWWFPIVGRIPYLGFFDKKDALEAAKKLKDDGFDIYLRPQPRF